MCVRERERERARETAYVCERVWIGSVCDRICVRVRVRVRVRVDIVRMHWRGSSVLFASTCVNEARVSAFSPLHRGRVDVARV